MCVYDKLKSLGITLPTAPPKGGVYVPVREFGNSLVYVSGNGPDINGEPYKRGKLGKELTLEEGKEAARLCALNILASLHSQIGDLNRIKSFVKVLGLVASTDEFFEQPQVMNGATELFEAVFGSEVGLAARSAIGTNVLPGNIPVEVELLLELK